MVEKTIEQMLSEVFMMQQKSNKIILDVVQNLIGQVNQTNQALQEVLLEQKEDKKKSK
jgi:hypothetical protein